MKIGDRLKNERKRLGLNQKDFGEQVGVSKTTQINYEKGNRSPDSNYLVAADSVGVDVLYVLKGERLLTFPGVSEEAAPYQWPSVEEPEAIYLMRQIIVDLERLIQRRGLKLDAEAKARVITATFSAAVKLQGEDATDSGAVEDAMIIAMTAAM